MSTIFAVSSGRPPAAIAVIRISGPDAIDAARALAGPLPEPRRAGLRLLRDGDGAPLDRALVLVFPAAHSATGENLVELHCHGGRAVVAAVGRALAAQSGCRLAEPGEFTRRSLANGRIDLAEAEGLADLLSAETEAQRVAALGAAEGRVSREVDRWMARVAELSAGIEAILDHADEDDVGGGDDVIISLLEDAHSLGCEIAAIASGPPVERVRDGVRVVIAGPPNAGKSTLLNLLAERDAAIVSPIAGTTRDRIEASVAHEGVAYVLSDTAGITSTDNIVEAIGVTRAEEAIGSADILLWLGDGGPPRHDALWIQARADLPGRSVLLLGRSMLVRQDSPQTIADLWRLIGGAAATLLPRGDMLPLRERHRSLCNMAAKALLHGSADPVLVGEYFRVARNSLAEITGRNATESMLDNLFSRFCIGK
jgi:tRNA modification GTPase